ncbi:hypothetical protein DB30_04410 [Enhygromyxa salina]|uniref:Uncharacterized protein n=1 Tax=Enhygromyxa salina TaxID=215803 RepID=A0A0C2D939_9BACT|nr:hypothetical protein DB30_04410 [Enhygromyxa salina]
MTSFSDTTVGDTNDTAETPGDGDGDGDDGEPDLPSDTADEDTSETTTDGGLPELRECVLQSTDYGGPLQPLDAPVGSDVRLIFEVPSLPDPALVEDAILTFDSYDADHPNQEGMVWVNGAGPYDLPANLDWDNMSGTGSIDVSGTTIAGLNTIEFGPGTLEPASVYQIGNLQLTITAHVEACPDGPGPPDPNAIAREVWYHEANYTKRHNWVLRCAPGFEYAFSAYGDEHIPSDCGGLYNPDGSRTGTAIFHFDDVVPATYEIQLRSRHTVNRNPMGALFVVDGVGKRIFQNDDQDFTTDIWGNKALSGDVDIVLDSTMENASDSVQWVKIVPVGN